MHKIGEPEKEIFRQLLYICADELGIHNLIIKVWIDDLSDDNANAAFIYVHEAQCLDVYINSNGIEEITGNLIEDIAYNAFHETGEGGLFGFLANKAEQYIPEQLKPTEAFYIEADCHAKINALWPRFKDRILRRYYLSIQNIGVVE